MRSELRINQRAWDTGGESLFRGIWGSGGTAFAIGKIYFFHGSAGWSEGDIVCVFDDFEYTAGPLFSPAGVIISAGAVCSELIGFLSKTGIPYLILKEAFSEEYAGKVALLDTERDILIIDPSIDTLNDYALLKKAVAPRTAEILLSAEPSEKIIMGRKKGGALVTGVRDGDIFDMLLGVAEQFCSLPVTVSLSLPSVHSEMESFFERAEAIFRAAVYGNFSVQLEGYRNAEDIVSALSYMHRVFCRLEEEGREFNGYLCRGILIDAPVWLSRASPFPKADFVCFDMDRLTSLLLGREISCADDADVSGELLMGVWKNYFSHFALGCPIRAKSKLLSSSEFFRKWLELAYVDELYIE